MANILIMFPTVLLTSAFVLSVRAPSPLSFWLFGISAVVWIFSEGFALMEDSSSMEAFVVFKDSIESEFEALQAQVEQKDATIADLAKKVDTLHSVMQIKTLGR